MRRDSDEAAHLDYVGCRFPVTAWEEAHGQHGALIGGLDGVAMAVGVGKVLRATGVYTPVFVVAGSIYFRAVVAIHWLTPRLEMVKIA